MEDGRKKKEDGRKKMEDGRRLFDYASGSAQSLGRNREEVDGKMQEN
jgi:hypothetical protein